MEFGLTSITLFILTSYCVADQSIVNMQYLRRVEGLQVDKFLQFYISCTTEGQIIQWGTSNSTLGGFTTNSAIGDSIANSLGEIDYVIVLLERKLLDNFNFLFISVMIIFVPEHSTEIEVSCSNNINIDLIGSESKPVYFETNDAIQMLRVNDIAVALDYVLTAQVFPNSSSLLHIITCATNNSLQMIGFNGEPAIAFNGNDNIGTVKTVPTGNEIHSLAVLGFKQLNISVTVLFANTIENFTYACGFQSSVLETQSKSEFSQYTNVTTSTTQLYDLNDDKDLNFSSSSSKAQSTQKFTSPIILTIVTVTVTMVLSLWNSEMLRFLTSLLKMCVLPLFLYMKLYCTSFTSCLILYCFNKVCIIQNEYFTMSFDFLSPANELVKEDIHVIEQSATIIGNKKIIQQDKNENMMFKLSY